MRQRGTSDVRLVAAAGPAVPPAIEGGTYPTTFEAIYDPVIDAYHLVFRDFANVD